MKNGLGLAPLMLVTTLAFSLVSFSCAAKWQVIEPESRVSFISVKKGDIGEVHHFKQVAGQLKDNGQFELSIPLVSVATGIEVRDDRLQNLLFEVARFPELKVSATLDSAVLNDLIVGASKVVEIDGKIKLHGKEQTKTFSVMLTKVSDNKMVVVSFQPVIVNANEFNLVAGVEKLREIAGLSSISQAVPVSFVLTLAQ
ncbi:YceI family protein [Shewanella sp. A25]|nr:YceI family protein [Shewanella shenzhenensis]